MRVASGAVADLRVASPRQSAVMLPTRGTVRIRQRVVAGQGSGGQALGVARRLDVARSVSGCVVRPMVWRRPVVVASVVMLLGFLVGVGFVVGELSDAVLPDPVVTREASRG